MRLRRVHAVLAVLGTLTLIAAACTTIQIDEDSRVGQKAPDFTLPDVDGRPVSFSKYQGKVVVLDFWASWCAPCVMELPVFQNLHNQYRDKGFEILGINVSDDNPNVADFLKKNNIKYTNLVGDERIQELYGPITGFPTTFIIDREGTIRGHYVGAHPRDEIEGAILHLL